MPVHSQQCRCVDCRKKTEIERLKSATTPEPVISDAEKFDLDPRFGPCSGITRHQRALRALDLNLGLEEARARALLSEKDKEYGFSK